MNDEKREPARIARSLIRACDAGALATIDPATGEPYASLVLVAADHDAAPILLLSALAEHTRNIEQDANVSLLLDGTAGLASRLTGARLSLQGHAVKSTEARHRTRFLARHPDAAAYVDFSDFGFYRIEVARGHLVAGFGQIEWIAAADILQPEATSLPLVADEAGVIEHMNQDHGDAIALYAQYLAGRSGGDWRMTGCDSEGIDLRREGEVCRIEFESGIKDAAGARAELVRLVQQARENRDESAASC
jgi:putative heme iron utilization protein